MGKRINTQIDKQGEEKSESQEDRPTEEVP